jgi:ion channel-forming bestrophin family protein
MGRGAWGDVIRNARTMGRLIWFHVPPRLKAKSENEKPTTEELAKVMAEKRMALDLVEGFAVSLKHHLRGMLPRTRQDGFLIPIFYR